MSFLRITDHSKRNSLVRDYLAMKGRIQQMDRELNTVDYLKADEMAKTFKPITSRIEKVEEKVKGIPDILKYLPEQIAKKAGESLPPMIESMKKNLTPALKESEGKLKEEGDSKLGEILQNIAIESENFGPLFKIEDQKLKLGDNPITFKKDTIVYNKKKKYDRTPELMDLLFSLDPSEDSAKNLEAMADFDWMILTFFSKTRILEQKVPMPKFHPVPFN